MADKRLKGQEISIKMVVNSVVVSELNAIGTFSDSLDIELKKDVFLGETGPRYDEAPGGVSGNLDFQVSTASWADFSDSVEARSRREQPDTVFNLVRADLFADGTSNVYTYPDVSFGPIPTSVPSQTEFVKVSLSFGCTRRLRQANNLV